MLMKLASLSSQNNCTSNSNEAAINDRWLHRLILFFSLLFFFVTLRFHKAILCKILIWFAICLPWHFLSTQLPLICFSVLPCYSFLLPGCFYFRSTHSIDCNDLICYFWQLIQFYPLVDYITLVCSPGALVPSATPAMPSACPLVCELPVDLHDWLGPLCDHSSWLGLS